MGVGKGRRGKGPVLLPIARAYKLLLLIALQAETVYAGFSEDGIPVGSK